MRTLLLLLGLILITGFASARIPDTDREPGELLVQLKNSHDQVLPKALTEDFRKAGIVSENLLSKSMNIWQLFFDESAVNGEKLLTQIRNHPMVNLAQFNHKVTLREIIPNDPSFSAQWALKNIGQMNGIAGSDIRATYAWEIENSGMTVAGDTIVIGMVDGGVDLAHNDLRLWKNKREIPNNGIDDDGNGYIDDYHGWNAYGNNGNVLLNDHGTHVAGIAAAKGNNNIGVTGVAYNTFLMPIAGESTNEAVVVNAYSYIFTMRKIYNQTNGNGGAFVVVTNSSFGVNYGNPANYPLWSAMYDSLGSVGILNVASTANGAWDVDIYGDIPTAMTNESLVAVTNTNNKDVLYQQAAWGANSIDLGAPGTDIFSSRSNNQYGYKTGTSMASPHVSGTIALMYAAADAATIQECKTNPEMVAIRFKRYLLASVDSLPSLVGKTVSGGRLNLLKTLQMVKTPPQVIAKPGAISMATSPQTISITELLLTTDVAYNTFSLSIPDTATWLSADIHEGVLHHNSLDTVVITINPNNLAEGDYKTSIILDDYYFNRFEVPVEIKVRIGVNTSLQKTEKATLTVAPNPVTSESVISFFQETAAPALLEVYDLTGRKRETLLNALTTPGIHSIRWNPNNLTPGIYLLKLTHATGTEAVKVVIR